jgi:hypothetical protein
VAPAVVCLVLLVALAAVAAARIPEEHSPLLLELPTIIRLRRRLPEEQATALPAIPPGSCQTIRLVVLPWEGAGDLLQARAALVGRPLLVMEMTNTVVGLAGRLMQPGQEEAAVVPVQQETAGMPTWERLELERPSTAVMAELAKTPTEMVVLAVFTVAPEGAHVGPPPVLVETGVLEPKDSSGLPIHQIQQYFCHLPPTLPTETAQQRS